MNRYQKGKTNLDFTEARDSEWQWHQKTKKKLKKTNRKLRYANNFDQFTISLWEKKDVM